jgi:hypothetical protein
MTHERGRRPSERHKLPQMTLEMLAKHESTHWSWPFAIVVAIIAWR